MDTSHGLLFYLILFNSIPIDRAHDTSSSRFPFKVCATASQTPILMGFLTLHHYVQYTSSFLFSCFVVKNTVNSSSAQGCVYISPNITKSHVWKLSPRPISTWCMPRCAGNARHGVFVTLSWWCMRDRQILGRNLNTSGNRQRQAQTALRHPDNEQGFVTTTSVQHKCQQRNTPSNPSETLVSYVCGN